MIHRIAKFAVWILIFVMMSFHAATADRNHEAIPPHSAAASATRIFYRDQLLQDADSGNLKGVQEAIEQGADVNATQQNGWTALMLAAQSDHVSIVKYLLAHGADVFKRSTLYEDTDALELPVETGNIPITRMLLDHGAKINERNNLGETPLLNASVGANLSVEQVYQMVRFLIHRGADVNLANNHGDTPLSYAKLSPGTGRISGKRRRLWKTIKLLEAAGANTPGETASDSKVESLRTRQTTRQTMPAPTMAALSSKIFYREQLLEDADIGNFKGVKLAVENGADVNSAQQNGWTALMLAASNGHMSIVKYLLAHGADPRKTSTLYDVVDALELAVESGSIPITKMLLDQGLDINERNYEGATPIMRVLGNGNISTEQIYQMVQFLIQRGADVTIVDKLGNSALSIATGDSRWKPGLSKTVQLLKVTIARKQTGK